MYIMYIMYIVIHDNNYIILITYHHCVIMSQVALMILPGKTIYMVFKSIMVKTDFTLLHLALHPSEPVGVHECRVSICP